jgi:hypothetical protein
LSVLAIGLQAVAAQAGVNWPSGQAATVVLDPAPTLDLVTQTVSDAVLGGRRAVDPPARHRPAPTATAALEPDRHRRAELRHMV